MLGIHSSGFCLFSAAYFPLTAPPSPNCDNCMKWVLVQEDLRVERLVIANRQSGNRSAVHQFVAQGVMLTA